MYTSAGVSGAVGVVGTTLGTISLVKVSKMKTEFDAFHTEVERRLATEEGMTKQFNKAVSQLQDVLEDHDMLRRKK